MDAVGTYRKNVVNNKLQVNTGDTKYIKRSNMNTPGLIAAKVDNPTAVLNASCHHGKCPTNWVQFVDPYNYTQGYYIDNKGGYSICQMDVSNAGMKTCSTADCKARSYFIGGKKFYSTLYVKSTSAGGAIPAGEYTETTFKTKKLFTYPSLQTILPTEFESYIEL